MICTYIFEDNWRNTLADAVNIKNPKVYIDMKPMLGTCMWEVRECKRFKHKGETFEQTIAYSPAVRLVGAVLSAHDEVLINTAHDCFPDLQSEESYFCVSENSIFVPEEMIRQYFEDQGEPVRGIDVKPRYITPISIDTDSGGKNYYAVSVIYTSSIYIPTEDSRYFRQIQPDLVDLADQILDLNNISHTKNKPYYRYGFSFIRPSHTRATIQHSEFDDIGFNIACDDNIWYGKHLGFSKENNFLLPKDNSTWVYNMPKGTIVNLIDKHLNSPETELFSLATFNIYNDKKFTERIIRTINNIRK
jgi:hypothetical protein